VPSNVDVDAYLSLLRVDGVLVNVGLPSDLNATHNIFSLVLGRRSIAASSFGSIRETQEMLKFCAEHGVTPEIERIGAGDVDKAWQSLDKVRYRYVIDIATLTGQQLRPRPGEAWVARSSTPRPIRSSIPRSSCGPRWRGIRSGDRISVLARTGESLTSDLQRSHRTPGVIGRAHRRVRGRP
jgi:hypothetical protein